MVTPEKSNYFLDLYCDNIDYKLFTVGIKYKNPGYVVNAQYAFVAQEKKVGLDITSRFYCEDHMGKEALTMNRIRTQRRKLTFP
jgi:hypothetical protein